MTKIAIIGAGGYEFPLQLMNDFLSFPSLQDAHVRADGHRPAVAWRAPSGSRGGSSRRTACRRGSSRPPIAPTALRGADFVVVCFQVGGRDAYAVDMEIPRRYGVDQTVGDTLGPGGVFRGLRSMKALEEITRDMRELCPDALLLNYANPMAINCWFALRAGHPDDGAVPLGPAHGRRAGLDHGPRGRHLVVPRGRDQPPGLDAGLPPPRPRRAAPSSAPRSTPTTAASCTPARPLDEWYAGGRESVRTAIMNLTGYFQTESSHHASEYYPHFRRDARRRGRAAARSAGTTWRSPGATTRRSSSRWPSSSPTGRLRSARSTPRGSSTRCVTNTPRVVYGNVPNTGLITNLPDGCCVEVPCLVDQNGVQPTFVGDLPAAVRRDRPRVGRATSSASSRRSGSGRGSSSTPRSRSTGSPSSLLSLDQIRAMTDEMIDARSSSGCPSSTDRPPAVAPKETDDVRDRHRTGTCSAGAPSPPRSSSTTRSAGCRCGCAATPPRWAASWRRSWSTRSRAARPRAARSARSSRAARAAGTRPFTELVNARRVSLAHVEVFHMDECLDWQGKPISARPPLQLPRLHGAATSTGRSTTELNVPEEQPALARAGAAGGDHRRRSLETPADLVYGGWGQDGHIAYNQARRHPFSPLTVEQLRRSTARVQDNNVDTVVALAQRTFGGAYQFVPPMSVTLGHARDPGRTADPAVQRHRRLEADGPARRRCSAR